MDPGRFWKLIEDARGGAHEDTGVFDTQLRELLSELAAREIQEFRDAFLHRMLECYSWAVWGAASVTMQGCSAEDFEVFRAWLISKGRETFEAVCRQPDRLAQVDVRREDVDEAEQVLDAAVDCYVARTGDPPPEPEDAGSYDAAQPEGEAFDVHDAAALQQRYPQLSRLFLQL